MSRRQFIAWKVLELRPEIASVRYRALLPSLGLSRRGLKSILFQNGESLVSLSHLAAVIFVKSFSPADLKLTTLLSAERVPIVLDLCDNVFVPDYGGERNSKAFAAFGEMAALASAVVAPTHELANEIRKRVPEAIPIVIIPDQLETLTTAEQSTRFPAILADCRHCVVPRMLSALPRDLLEHVVPVLRRSAYVLDRTGRRRHQLYSLARRILGRPAMPSQDGSNARDASPSVALDSMAPQVFNKRAARKRVIWFGNHGAPHSRFGLPALAELLPHLQEVNSQIGLELLVVSNNRQRFRQLFSNVPFPVEYREWGLTSIFADLSEADVCVLPNPLDAFSIGKSANRALLALSNGVPVVATYVSSLDSFRECILFDDWVGGLTTYLSDPTRGRRDVLRAREVIVQRFSERAVVDLWQNLIEDVTGTRKPADESLTRKPSQPSAVQNYNRTTDATSSSAVAHHATHPELCVAMCTYNGERFLDEQLRSLARQTLLPHEVIICDDGSVDGTLDIIRAFARTAPFAVRLIQNAKRLGISRNVDQALRTCTGYYVALADQDDIWEPNKLSLLVDELKKAEARYGRDKPVLVHTDMRVIDASGGTIAESFFRRRGLRPAHTSPLRELVAQSYVTGCATIINRPVLRSAIPIPPQAVVHDWWLALVAAATGMVITINRPTVKYRLHTANAVGPKRREWRPFLRPSNARYQFLRALSQSRALEHRLRECAYESKELAFLGRYHRLSSTGGIRAAVSVFRDGVRLQNWVPSLALFAHICLRSLTPSNTQHGPPRPELKT